MHTAFTLALLLHLVSVQLAVHTTNACTAIEIVATKVAFAYQGILLIVDFFEPVIIPESEAIRTNKLNAVNVTFFGWRRPFFYWL